jgi:hypothetical protein
MSVHLATIGGMTQITNLTFTITYVDPNNFTLDGINSTAYTTYTSGGTATPAISRSNPAIVSSIAHGFGNGQVVTPTLITGHASFIALNGLNFKIKNVTADTFELTDLAGNNIDSSGFASPCTNAGTWTQWRKIAIQSITNANPAVVTANGHGYSNSQLIVLEVEGMTEVNGKTFTVANASTNTFELSGIDSSSYGTFTSGECNRPFLTPNVLATYYSAILQGRFYTGDSISIGKTFVPASVAVGSGNITFTRNSQTVTTSVDLRASLAVNNYIGLTTATVEGCFDSGDPTITRPDMYYRISAITASDITIETAYAREYVIEKNLRCVIGEFAVKKTAVCDIHVLKQSND